MICGHPVVGSSTFRSFLYISTPETKSGELDVDNPSLLCAGKSYEKWYSFYYTIFIICEINFEIKNRIFGSKNLMAAKKWQKSLLINSKSYITAKEVFLLFNISNFCLLFGSHPYFAHKYAIFNSSKFRVLINNKFNFIINLEYSCIRV